MEATIVIFDLDDTLVGPKMKIPRQTYHLLNWMVREKILIGVITYNGLCQLVAKETNLYKYTHDIVYQNVDRDVLFDRCLQNVLSRHHVDTIRALYYVDDRKDHLETVVESNPGVIPFHCVDLHQLFQLKKTIKKMI